MYQRFVKHASFPLIAARQGLPGLCRQIRFLGESQFWPLERLQEFQLAKLRRLLLHAEQNVLFYRKRFEDAGFDPRSLSDLDQLKKLPVLTKKDIRGNLSSLLAQNIPKNNLHKSETGGTSGVKMEFYRDNACLVNKEALRLRFDTWSGWEPGERMGLVWPATVDYVGHYTLKARIKNEMFERQVVLPAAVLDEEVMDVYSRELARKRITFIRAFPSPLYELARYFLKKNIHLHLKGVVTTGEPLYFHQREVIEKAFNCPVLDSYRCREVGPIAQQCREQRGLHVNAESLVVEIVPEGEGESGAIVVTDLENYGLPLIRYSMGDYGRWSGQQCSCGRGLPLVEEVSGRAGETFVTPEGKRIMAGSLVLYLVDEAPGMLGQVQVVQDRVDHLLIRMTPDPPPSDEIKAFHCSKVQELFGPKMSVSYEIVEQIPRSASGKYSFAICNVGKKANGQ